MRHVKIADLQPGDEVKAPNGRYYAFERAHQRLDRLTLSNAIDDLARKARVDGDLLEVAGDLGVLAGQAGTLALNGEHDEFRLLECAGRSWWANVHRAVVVR